MTDHEKRVREALADLDGFYHDDTVEWTTNVSATDLRALLADLDAMRGALEDCLDRIEKSEFWWMDCPDRGGFDAEAIRAALTAAKAGGWVAVPDCPDGDVWFALSCGHVVIGYKTGDMLDWEAMIDHDCCSDAHAVKAQPVATPTPPKDPA